MLQDSAKATQIETHYMPSTLEIISISLFILLSVIDFSRKKEKHKTSKKGKISGFLNRIFGSFGL